MKTASGQEIKTLAQANEAGATVIAYGQFINVMIDFIIVAFVFSCLLKVSMTSKAKNTKSPSRKKRPRLASIAYRKFQPRLPAARTVLQNWKQKAPAL